MIASAASALLPPFPRKVTPVSAFLLVLAALASFVLPSSHPAATVAAPAPVVDTRPITDPTSDPRVAAILVTLGDYAPADGRGVLTDAQWSALLPVYRASETTGADCASVARTLMVTGAFTGAMVPCLGEEDSPAVDTLLTLGHH